MTTNPGTSGPQFVSVAVHLAGVVKVGRMVFGQRETPRLPEELITNRQLVDRSQTAVRRVLNKHQIPLRAPGAVKLADQTPS